MAKGRPSKKHVILDTAQQLFALHGYQGTAIDLVVREAGVSKPTVYNNFPSKQALLQSLISRQLAIIETRQRNLVISNSDCLDRLFDIFSQVITHPFELALYKIYYGESYKLDQLTLQLFMQMAQLTENNCRLILNHGSHKKEQTTAIIAIYKNALLTNTLASKSSPDKGELNSAIQVLGLMSEH